MDSKQIAEYYNQVLSNAGEYAVNESYVDGDNWTILHQKEKKEPDNKLTAPFAKKFIDFMYGYAGANIKINYEAVEQDTENEEEIKEREYQQLMKELAEYNDDDVHLSELYIEAISQKRAYELFWTSDNMELPNGMVTPDWKMIEANRGLMVYDNGLKPKALYFVLFTKIDDDTTVCDIYYPLYSEGYILDKRREWARDESRDTTYPYTKVPCIEYKMSKKGGPLFKPIKRMIDQIDKMVSRSADELERFANITLLMPDRMDKDFSDKLRTAILTMIDDLGHLEGDKWPRYLEKNLQGVSEYQKNLLDWVVDHMHECIGIPDIMDERFAGGAESGVARAFKLISMEYAASHIEMYFFKGLYERKLMIDDVIKASVASIKPDEYTIEITAERDLPLDEQTKAQVAQTLKGIVSDETLIKKILGKIVGNGDDELKRLEKERKNNPLVIPPVEEEAE